MRDVLVKGMKMPKTCLDCVVVKYDDEECEYYCPFSNKIAFRDSRRASCPFVELPEHGNLIDRDKLLELADTQYCHAVSSFMIITMPVIIPAERGMNE